jgi:hypothetical protein
VRAVPPRREGVPPMEREVRARVRRVEQLHRRFGFALDDERQARAGRRATELRVAQRVRRF